MQYFFRMTNPVQLRMRFRFLPIKYLFPLFAFAIVGCGPLLDEVGYPGGYVDATADRKVFLARTQQQRADRYLMSLTILAPLAASLTEGGAEANAASTLILSSYKTLSEMSEAIDAKCLTGSATTLCTVDGKALNSEFSFESHTYELQKTLYALASLSLTAADLDDVVDDIIALNYLGIFLELRRIWPVLRRSFATYRDTIVIFSDAIVTTGSCTTASPPPACENLKALLKDLTIGTEGITPSGDEVYRPIRKMASALQDMTHGPQVGEKGNPNWSLKPRHRSGLVYHIDQACIVLKSAQTPDFQGSETDCGSANSTAIAKVIRGPAAAPL